jgi:uncharacterized protein (DUF2249 family)
MSRRAYRTLDVRPLFERGDEPFAVIRKSVDALTAKEGLVLITPFLPSPLIEILQNEGFKARPERRSDGSWQTCFTREKGPKQRPLEQAPKHFKPPTSLTVFNLFDD